MAVKLREKIGDGVGAQLPFEDSAGNYVGTLTFHDQHDWGVSGSANSETLGWDPFDEALAVARESYPRG